MEAGSWVWQASSSGAPVLSAFFVLREQCSVWLMWMFTYQQQISQLSMRRQRRPHRLRPHSHRVAHLYEAFLPRWLSELTPAPSKAKQTERTMTSTRLGICPPRMYVLGQCYGRQLCVMADFSICACWERSLMSLLRWMLLLTAETGFAPIFHCN